jgi:hypothetical protein
MPPGRNPKTGDLDELHSRIEPTIIEVWADWKKIRGLKRCGYFSRSHQFSDTRHIATRAIGLEVELRMKDANRTEEEALGDLEGARLKMVVRGGPGTIASLAYAIKAKNGMKVDSRLKPKILEY